MIKKNFFNIFNLPVSYKVNEAQLLRAYFDLQKHLHPDSAENLSLNAVAIGVNEDSMPENMPDIAEVNLAYQTLANPIDRAEYFLKTQGIDVANEVCMDFAEEMFAIREKFASMVSEKEKKDFIEALKKRSDEIVKLLEENEANLEKFKSYTGLLRFINSFLEKVRTNAYNRD